MIRFQITEDYIRCKICQFPLCGASCEAGEEHLGICKYLKGKGSLINSVDASSPIYEAILPLKLAVMKKDLPEKYALISNLMDHKDQRLAFEDYWKDVKENVVDFISEIEDLRDVVSEEEIFRLMGIIDTNAHEISNQSGRSFKGLFPLGAILSHRCVVNSRQIMIKETPYPNTCRSTVFIRKGSSKRIPSYLSSWVHISPRDFLILQQGKKSSPRTFGLTSQLDNVGNL